MVKQNPHKIVIRRLVTEKANVLASLKSNESNKSIARCEKPKYVFLVDPKANKKQIAQAVEEIYGDKNIKVTAVNTINVKSKPTRRLRSRGKTHGRKAARKKAIVTLEPKDSLDE